MRKNLLLTLVLCLSFLLAVPQDGFADTKELKKKIYKQRVQDLKLGKGQMGRKFIVAVPPNETASFGWSDSAMEIYVAGANDTDLELSILGSKKKEKLKAGEVIVINDEMGLTKTAAEIREPNTATDKTVIIEASKPVSVYVMNSKSTTSDGYMALPVDSWQKEYMHCSYYDNYESSTNKFANGFLVLGSEDKTTVTVELRGYGTKSIATLKNRNESLEDEITFRINEGQVYQVESDGLTRGEFDISGSSVIATKPIGIISYHWRAVIPIFTSSSRDHLCAMPMPVATWGQKYASVCLERNGSKKGDMFRVMAAEPNTNFNVKWYDLETREFINGKSGFLKNKGDWEEVASHMSSSAEALSVTGSSVFEADKPIFVMQYSYSGGWDGSSYDPFMWPITSVEQYIPSTIVQAPSNKSFAENYINIIALHDTNDVAKEGLKSIAFDGTKITDKVPSFTTNRIPGTNLYWARFKIAPGPHEIKGDGEATFGGYIYGFKSVDSYGWPAAMALRNLSETDTVPPVVEIEGECGEWTVHVTELTVDPNEDADPRQVDSEVWSEPAVIIKDSTVDGTHYMSYNMEVVQYVNKAKQPIEWKYEPHNDYYFLLSVKDKFEDAKCYFYVADDEGNITIDSVEYFADKFALVDPDPIEFGRKQIMEDHTLDVTFKNIGNGPVEFSAVELVENEFFSIVPDVLDFDKTELMPNEEMSLRLQYSPTEEIEDKEDFDLDSIFFEAECITFSWPITGQGVTPKIKVEDWTVQNPIAPGNFVIKEGGVRIENNGSAPLIITEANFTGSHNPPFSFTPDFTYPITIPSRMFSENGNDWSITVEEAKFAPTAVGSYNEDLVFTSNAFDPDGNDDSVSIWIAYSSLGDVNLSNALFPKTHLGLKSEVRTVTISNNSTGDDGETVVVTTLRFGENEDPTITNNFKFVHPDNGQLVDVIDFTNGKPNEGLTLYKQGDGSGPNEKTIEVYFIPGTAKNADGVTYTFEKEMTVGIVADYYTESDQTQTINEAPNSMTGQGTLPDIEVSAADYKPTPLYPADAYDINDLETIRTNAEIEKKTITIKNADTEEALEVNGIKVLDSFAQHFIVLTIGGVKIEDVVYPLYVDSETPLEVEYAFAPKTMYTGSGKDGKGYIYETPILVEANHIPAQSQDEVTPVEFNQYEEDNTKGFLRGWVLEGDASVVGHPFEKLMRCDTREAYITLNNLSVTQNLKVKDVVITGDDEGVFYIPDSEITRLQNTLIGFNGNEKCKVEFQPANVDKDLYEAADDMTLSFEAEVYMVYEFDGTPVEKMTSTSTLTASARLLNIDISQQIEVKSTAGDQVPIQPGMFSFDIGGGAPYYTNYFMISMDNNTSDAAWSDFDIDELSISYKYKKDWMGFVESGQKFDLNAGPGFDVTKTGTVEEGEYFIDTYTITTNNPAGSYLNYEGKVGALLNPHFLLYLSGDTEYMPEITELSFGSRDECIVYTASTEEIPLANCIQDINLISSSGGANLAPTLAPNPVVTSKATITYGLALNAQASLKLYNEEGKVVKVIVDSYQNAGTHTVDVNTEDLPNGVYIMRLEQNSFVGEGNMVISK